MTSLNRYAPGWSSSDRLDALPMPPTKSQSSDCGSKAHMLAGLRKEEDLLMKESDTIRKMLSQLEAQDIVKEDNFFYHDKEDVDRSSGTLQGTSGECFRDENRSNNQLNAGARSADISGGVKNPVPDMSDISCFKQAAILSHLSKKLHLSSEVNRSRSLIYSEQRIPTTSAMSAAINSIMPLNIGPKNDLDNHEEVLHAPDSHGVFFDEINYRPSAQLNQTQAQSQRQGYSQAYPSSSSRELGGGKECGNVGACFCDKCSSLSPKTECSHGNIVSVA